MTSLSAIREDNSANELEQRLWSIIDRDGLGDVPSDIVGAVARLVDLAKSAEASEARAGLDAGRKG